MYSQPGLFVYILDSHACISIKTHHGCGRHVWRLWASETPSTALCGLASTRPQLSLCLPILSDPRLAAVDTMVPGLPRHVGSVPINDTRKNKKLSEVSFSWPSDYCYILFVMSQLQKCPQVQVRTGFAEREVIFWVIRAQHRVGVCRQCRLGRRALVQRAVLGFSTKKEKTRKVGIQQDVELHIKSNKMSVRYKWGVDSLG